MGFWFFKKRENSKDTKTLHSKIENIDKKFHTSFQNVKKDMADLSIWLKEMHKKHLTHATKLENYDSRLELIEQKLKELLPQNKTENADEQELNEVIMGEDLTNNEIITSLTTTDKRLFRMVYQLQKQLGGNPISFKSLASMAYPSKDYINIRTTISQYLNTLHKFGLIEKKRVGREAFISLTDLGFGLIKEKIKQEREIRNKKKPKFT